MSKNRLKLHDTKTKQILWCDIYHVQERAYDSEKHLWGKLRRKGRGGTVGSAAAENWLSRKRQWLGKQQEAGRARCDVATHITWPLQILCALPLFLSETPSRSGPNPGAAKRPPLWQGRIWPPCKWGIVSPLSRAHRRESVRGCLALLVVCLLVCLSNAEPPQNANAMRHSGWQSVGQSATIRGCCLIFLWQPIRQKDMVSCTRGRFCVNMEMPSTEGTTKRK